jgi:hypothetical protein
VNTSAYGLNKFGVIAGSYGTETGFGGFLYKNGSYKYILVNGQPTSVSDINDYGYYVGIYGASGAFTAFMASPGGQITTLAYPGSLYTSPTWIKNSGEVIGTYLASPPWNVVP